MEPILHGVITLDLIPALIFDDLLTLKGPSGQLISSSLFIPPFTHRPILPRFAVFLQHNIAVAFPI